MYKNIIAIYTCKSDIFSEKKLLASRWFKLQLDKKKDLVILFYGRDSAPNKNRVPSYKEQIKNIRIGAANRVYLDCEESYSALSIKTFKMFEFINMLGIRYDYVVKIDATLINYESPHNSKEQNFKNFEKCFRNGYFKGDYGGISKGIIVSASKMRESITRWSKRKSIEGNINIKKFENNNFYPKFYYRGKSYYVSRRFASIIARKIFLKRAIEYNLYMGGSEDVFVGSIYQDAKMMWSKE